MQAFKDLYFSNLNLRMKTLNKFLLALLVSATTVGTAYADPVILGTWKIDTYDKVGGAHHTTQQICFNADKTWYMTTQGPWNGDWFQLGDEVWWYGSLPEKQNGAPTRLASMGMGQVINNQLMTGNYAEWTSPGTAPLPWDKQVTYVMTYLGPACPPPA
jgi:hypothetical protein